jgi:hypothetical protein
MALGMILGATVPAALWALRSPAARKAALEGIKKLGKYKKTGMVAGMVGGGIGGSYLENLLRDEEEQQTTLGPGSADALGGGAGMPPVADDFTSNLPSYPQRLRSSRSKYLNNMSTIVKHSMLLQFQNPGRKNSYMKNAIDLLKVDAYQQNELEVATMVDEVFKDGKVPQSARELYNKMVKSGASPKEAADVSGYTLKVDVAEAKSAADFAKTRDPSKFQSKDVLTMLGIMEDAKTDLHSAALKLSRLWGAGAMKLPEQYVGYETKDAQQLYQLAIELLSGSARGATGPATGTGVQSIRPSS